jgi:hypothetical protein
MLPVAQHYPARKPEDQDGVAFQENALLNLRSQIRKRRVCPGKDIEYGDSILVTAANYIAAVRAEGSMLRLAAHLQDAPAEARGSERSPKAQSGVF